jgi:hypothetical protein
VDARRFDTVAKAFASGTSRRQVLQGVRGAVAAVVGATLGLGVTEVARSKKRRAKVTAQRGKPAGRGRCTSPMIRCGGTCVDTQTNPKNCGACGKDCGAGMFCQGGTCVCTQASWEESCSGSCYCTTTVDGQQVCGEAEGSVFNCDSPCTSDPCPSGERCVVNNFNCGNSTDPGRCFQVGACRPLQ